MTTMPKAVMVSFKEGGNWFDWPLPTPEVLWSRNSEEFIDRRWPMVFAIRFDNGMIWDRNVGWREDTKPHEVKK